MLFLNMVFQVSTMLVLGFANFTDVKAIFFYVFWIDLVLIIMAILFVSY